MAMQFTSIVSRQNGISLIAWTNPSIEKKEKYAYLIFDFHT